LARIGSLLDRSSFDSIFLDKMRFPSPADGADEMQPCFCLHCHRAAAEIGLDLQEVTQVFETKKFRARSQRLRATIQSAMPGSTKIAPGSGIERFLRFRFASITNLVAEAGAEARKRGRRVALDLFSRSLALIVGQDYLALAHHTDWVKPMTYRLAIAPASLRLEIAAPVDSLAVLMGEPLSRVAQRCFGHLDGFGSDTLRIIRELGVPPAIVMQEVSCAVQQMGAIPVYFGLEVIRYPGVLDVTLGDAACIVTTGRDANAAGTIISWDLMHAPADGIRARGQLS
jgi:hypothetical protein